MIEQATMDEQSEGTGATRGRDFCRAPLRANEAERIAALKSYRILDTPREAAFDDITRIAALVCNVPIAVVNLIDSGRQWFKSEIGLGVRETALDVSICAHAILQPGLFIVPDTRRDPRFAANPLVAGEPHLRFYAGALLETPDGHPLGTLCVLDYRPRQLTEEQKSTLASLARQTMTQLEFRRALATAHRLGEYRGRVMARAGHDLKQPLQVISMLLDQIEPRLTDETDRQRLGRANSAVERLAAELDALTEASRAAAVGETPRPTVFAIGDALSRIGDAWREHANSKGMRLRIVHSAQRVLTDPPMLATILGNLVGNAIKYTEAGGVLVGCRRRGAMLAVEVVDTGCGIAEPDLGRIFEPFRQLQPDREGLGLGLAIARHTAILLGHPLGVSSVPGKGSRFSLELPFAALPPGATGGAGGGKHVLVVDDDDAVREVIAEALADHGYRVTRAVGAAGLRNVLKSTDRVDVVILDASLREANSASLAAHVKSLRLPLVMVSGDLAALSFARESGLQLLAKPFRQEQLLEAVGRAFASGEHGQRRA